MNNDERKNIINTIVSAWNGHSEFAEWLVRELNPTTIVDLGVDYGFSTFTFALPNIGTVYGIDSFQSDPQTGNHTDQLEKVNNTLRSLELDNIKIIQGFFSDVAKDWEKEIDILHIDGHHSYDSVKEDFDKWSKFLNDGGVILFHDTCIYREGFGVRKFFNELDLPKLNFRNSCGLGVATKNEDLLNKIRERFGDLIETQGSAKIAMISMFKNEAKNIRRMLDSAAPHIKYWVLQDNGSTDGTPDIVKQWAEETGIPGHLYQVEEGWVNFGWNRDHLLQTTLKLNHGCDWIMKMDCDETLEVDDDFDWSVFEDTSIQSFHVTSVAPSLIYFRAWIWNSKLPWKFNHDPAHETITLEMDGYGENFIRHPLDRKFRMIGGISHGESYSVKTKYISDALKLEEKLLREGTMLTDLYHFWYIGKSYEDCYRGDFFPLKEIHQKEYARRCIFYFEQVVNYKHNYNVTKKPDHIDEMAYYALNGIGNAYKFLGDHYKAIDFYKASEDFAPKRNDHLVYLAETYWELLDFKKMIGCTEKMMHPSRTNPFPDYHFLINQNMYYDTGKHVQFLHNNAKQYNRELHIGSVLAINKQQKPRMYIVDNFYEDPLLVRDFALQLEFNEDLNYYKGKRTKSHKTPQMRQRFEEILGRKITVWDEHGMNGVFQYCTPEDLLVYHWDSQTWAGMIYLTPNAPYQSGTSLFAHKATGARHETDPGSELAFTGGYYDRSKFDLVDTAGNVFNRLVLFDAKCIHAANEYFGQTIQDSRLFHLFFFD